MTLFKMTKRKRKLKYNNYFSSSTNNDLLGSLLSVTCLLLLHSLLLCYCSCWLPIVGYYSSASFVFVSAMDVTVDTCQFTSSNRIYRRGEPLREPQFQSRCGNVYQFPCICNPDLPQQIECPFCTFPTLGRGIVCAKPNESNIQFLDLNGVSQTCTCHENTSHDDLLLQQQQQHSGIRSYMPFATCQPGPGTTTTTNNNGSDDKSCILEIPFDGTRKIYSAGEWLGEEFTTRCGSAQDYPCFCDPDVPGGIYCPYCRYVNQNGKLICAKENESTTYIDKHGDNLNCNCVIDYNGEPRSICSDPVPTNRPPSAPVSPAQSIPTIPFQGPTSSFDGCEIMDDNTGRIVQFQNGQSLGSMFMTRCRNPLDYPCTCNTNAEKNIECPYCGYARSDGVLECARDLETIVYEDAGVTFTCFCDYIDIFTDPIKTCIRQFPSIAPINGGNIPPPTPMPIMPSTAPFQPVQPIQPSVQPSLPTAQPVPTVQPTIQTPIPSAMPSTPSPVEPLVGCEIDNIFGTVVIPEGESYGELVEGVCGPWQQWPTFCNLGLEDQREYPYCIYETQEFGTICAGNGGDVTFTDANTGVYQICYCFYTDIIFGAESICDPLQTETTPTATPGGEVPSSQTFGESIQPSITPLPTMSSAPTFFGFNGTDDEIFTDDDMMMNNSTNDDNTTELMPTSAPRTTLAPQQPASGGVGVSQRLLLHLNISNENNNILIQLDGCWIIVLLFTTISMVTILLV